MKETRTCPQCSSEFEVAQVSAKRYCSRECGAASRRGRPHTNRRRIEKVCPACQQTFETVPSRAHVVCCSYACRTEYAKDKPRTFSPETRAKLTGRPKTSADVERECPICSTCFTVPEWYKKTYCSISCGRKAAAKTRAASVSDLQKTCPVCEKPFKVYPSQSWITCCSTKCAGLLKRGAAMESVRQMAEGECMWLAGLFDGEGSIILSNRERPGGGTVKITVTNTVLALLERTREVTGIGIIRENPKRAQHHLDSWTWESGGAAALEVLRQVRPWLIVKADRADAVLAGETFPRQARWDHIYPE